MARNHVRRTPLPTIDSIGTVQKFGHDFIVTLGGIFWPNVGSLVELHKMSFGNYMNNYGNNLPNLKQILEDVHASRTKVSHLGHHIC